MARVPVENKTDRIMFKAGVLIPPNETRFIEESLLPKSVANALPVKKSESEHDLIQRRLVAHLDALKALLDDSIKDVSAKLHTVSLADLDALDVLEQDGENRKGMIEALTNERLRRAEIENNPDLTSVEKYVQVNRVG